MFELTPEERAKIYLEEKARREINLELDKEQKSIQLKAKRAKESTKKVGCLYVLGGLMMVPIVTSLLVSISQLISSIWIPILICGCLTISLKIIGFSKKDLIWVSGGALIIGIGVTFFLGNYFDKAKLEDDARIRASRMATVKASPTIKSHIQKAQALLKQVNVNSRNYKRQHELIAAANSEIESIPGDLRDFTNSQAVLSNAAQLEAQVAKREADYKTAHPSAADRLAAALIRQNYATKFENMLLEKNIDAKVTTGGKDRTTITVSYPLMNRPLVYSLMHNQIGTDGLKVLGFKRLVATDGYEQSWTIEL